MKRIFLGFLCLCAWGVGAQNQRQINNNDLKYLEDQFYLGLTYNFLLDKPTNFNQRNLSYGLQGGLIRDIPLNSARTFAIGLGLGYAINSYYSNMLAAKTSDGIAYELISGNSILVDGEEIRVKRNKIETQLVELPIEFRWRNSTPQEYKFWRVYSGIKLGYAFSSRSKLVTDVDKTSFTNPDIRKFQYGLTFNFGYNTFNVHIYYSLNGLFEDGIRVESEEIKLKPLQVGLIFYIL
ncbi:MAG: PorT family protein [Maribacter sp.]|nr:PorT family protein [Maribacter sp.]